MEIPFIQQIYWNNTLQKWLIAFGLVVLSAIIGKIVGWLFKKFHLVTAKTKYKFDSILVDMIEEPIVFIILVTGFRLSVETLTLPEKLIIWINKGIHILIAMLVGWMLGRLIDALMETYLKPIVESSENDLDDQLLPVARKGSKLLIWSLAFVIGMNNAGYDVGALIAGLGIGGLAFALAAKDSLSNLFGGFTIYADRPFTINDRIQVAGFDGTVKEIGLRSTRLVTVDGRMVTMPNMTFTDKPVENVSSEPYRRITLVLGLTYDTTVEKIEAAMAMLRDIATKHSCISDDIKLGFTSFSASSLDITFIYQIIRGSDIFLTQTEVNLAILKKFNEQGLEFAFPTQTIHAFNHPVI